MNERIHHPVSSDIGESLKGKILIAMPDMGDPRFNKAVIVMLEHSADGAMGLVINKALGEFQMEELLQQLEIPTTAGANTSLNDCPVNFGGPVELGRGFVLHSRDIMLEHSLDLLPVAVTTSMEMLGLIAEGRGPEKSIFCLGYTGWSAGQLEDEMRQNAWLHTTLNEDILFSIPEDERWNAAMKLAGVDPDFLSPMSGRA